MPIFEYDENKSQFNKQKHGIDFEEAKQLWYDKNAMIIDAKIVYDEKRFALIGSINNKCYVMIFTLRNFFIRISSVRRCRKNEELRYAQNTCGRI